MWTTLLSPTSIVDQHQTSFVIYYHFEKSPNKKPYSTYLMLIIYYSWLKRWSCTSSYGAEKSKMRKISSLSWRMLINESKNPPSKPDTSPCFHLTSKRCYKACETNGWCVQEEIRGNNSPAKQNSQQYEGNWCNLSYTHEVVMMLCVMIMWEDHVTNNIKNKMQSTKKFHKIQRDWQNGAIEARLKLGCETCSKATAELFQS